MEDECGVAIELGRTSPAFRSTFGTNVGIGSQGARDVPAPRRRRPKYLPRIASGEIIHLVFCPDRAGSRFGNSASVQTRARRDGDVYVLDGAKRFITNANKAGLFTVMTRTDRTRGRGRRDRLPGAPRPAGPVGGQAGRALLVRIGAGHHREQAGLVGVGDEAFGAVEHIDVAKWPITNANKAGLFTVMTRTDRTEGAVTAVGPSRRRCAGPSCPDRAVNAGMPLLAPSSTGQALHHQRQQGWPLHGDDPQRS